MSTIMSPDPVATKLQTLKAAVEAAKTEKTRAEARMEELKKQEEQILAELQALGVTPETVDQEIARLEAERDQMLVEAEQLLRGVAV